MRTGDGEIRKSASAFKRVALKKLSGGATDMSGTAPHLARTARDPNSAFFD
jgi:hypothetical protein